MTSGSPPPEAGGPTLADTLKAGPLPLESALRYGAEISRLLLDLHQQNRSYGNLSTSSVRLTPAGPELRPPRSHWVPDGAERDIRAFGALLYEMLTGTPLPADANRGMFRPAVSRSGLMGTRAGALRLAGKCLGLLDVRLSMQQVSTEARILWLLARQTGVVEDLPRPLPPTAAPFLVEPRDPEEHPPPQPSSSSSPETAGSHCPKCGSASVYFSRSRSAVERMLERMGSRICRCHQCYHRYLEIGSLQFAKEVPLEPALRKRPKRKR